MDDLRTALENALREFRTFTPLRGRSRERVQHLLQMALRTPSNPTVQRAVREIACCFESQGRGMDLEAFRRLSEVAGTPQR